MRRRLGVLLAATITALAGLAVNGPADAAPGGSCSIKVPARVKIDRPFQHVRATLRDDCYNNDWSYASWEVVHSYYGPDGIFIFDGNDSANWDVYDWDHTGRYNIEAEPGSSWDTEYNDLTQNTATSIVRFGSRTGLSVSRRGSYVTLRAHVTRYRSSAEAFRPWRKATRLQYRSADGAWHTLKTRTTARNGYVSVRLRAPHARVYRASTTGISTTWGSSSAAHRR